MILLGVTGGISAYKSIDIVRRLKEKGHDVRVVMTDAATRFVTPLTFRTVSGDYVATSMFAEDLPDPLFHVTSAKDADIFLIAPATADFIAKMAHGIGDDLLSTLVIAARCPVLIAPAMNTSMLSNQATQANLDILRHRGIGMIGPVRGKLAEGEGMGRMADVDEIVGVTERAIKKRSQLKGKKVIVTAGGTREPIDSVRFIGNYSSGKMGFAIAEEASRRGAEVTMVSGPTGLPWPSGVERIDTETTKDMFEEIRKRIGKADILIMAAAVADVAPRTTSGKKIKKEDIGSLDLVQTTDILTEIRSGSKGKVIVGFAAETEDLSKNARVKLKKKGLDMIVANDVSRKDIAFGSDYNQVIIIKKDGRSLNTSRMHKRDIAGIILDQINTV
jgi:phosphopantothenoylcysteine decarboxylase/phosphopantothenate--cysteine ligase